VVREEREKGEQDVKIRFSTTLDYAHGQLISAYTSIYLTRPELMVMEFKLEAAKQTLKRMNTVRSLAHTLHHNSYNEELFN
jgi:hypothetical protein